MKKLIVLTALILILFCVFIKSVSAQTTASPIVPEFSINYVSTSYPDGALAQNSSLAITIRNEPFASLTFRNGFSASVFYDILISYNRGSDELYAEIDGYSAQSDSNYTTINLPYINNTIITPLTLLTSSKTIEVNSIVSIQAQTNIGYITPDIKSYPNTAFIFKGQSSGWSNAQTVNLYEASSLPSQSVPEFPIIVFMPLIGLLLIAIVIIKVKFRSLLTTTYSV